MRRRMGRDLDDDTRRRRLDGTDPRFTVEHYCARGRSPLFSTGPEPKQLTVRDAFLRALTLRPEAGRAWLEVLGCVSGQELLTGVEELPDGVASPDAREFAKSALACNRKFLLAQAR